MSATDAAFQSSGGNVLLPGCQAADCALLLHRHGLAAVSTPVGGAPRERNSSLVAELQEEVSRSRGTWESEKEANS